jgi:hypothetical protein
MCSEAGGALGWSQLCYLAVLPWRSISSLGLSITYCCYDLLSEGYFFSASWTYDSVGY